MTDAIIFLLQLTGFALAMILAIVVVSILILLLGGAIKYVVFSIRKQTNTPKRYPNARKPKHDRQVTKEINHAVSTVNSAFHRNGKGAFAGDYERRRHPRPRK